MTPWLPSAVVAAHSVAWTILPVTVAARTEASAAARAHSSLQVPAAALALQSFSQALHSLAPNRTPRRDAPVEVRIHPVVPLGLDTVYVQLDTAALRRLDEVHARFGGGFVPPAAPNGAARLPRAAPSRADQAAQARAWRAAVREALQRPTVLHSGDVLPLPLPAHPITHAAPPPARIAACEPVAQGLLLPTTRVVVLQSRRSPRAVYARSWRTASNHRVSWAMRDVSEYSAAC